MGENREWMYKRFLSDGSFNPHFLAGLDSFFDYATSHPYYMDRDKIKCPYKKCDNIPYIDQKTVRYHIKKHGFVRGYQDWRFHGPYPKPETQQIYIFDVSTDEDYESQTVRSDSSSGNSTATSTHVMDRRFDDIERQLQEELEKRQLLQERIDAQRQLVDQLISQSTKDLGHPPPPPPPPSS